MLNLHLVAGPWSSQHAVSAEVSMPVREVIIRLKEQCTTNQTDRQKLFGMAK